MRVAVVFDTPYSGWDHSDHEREMAREVAAWKSDEPEMEYQIAHALQKCGHEVRLPGVREDLEYLVRHLGQWRPDLVFNGAEARRRVIDTPARHRWLSRASVVQDVSSLADRVSFIHERFGQGAIAEEFVDGRELYVSR
jgi:hypothetical protein